MAARGYHPSFAAVRGSHNCDHWIFFSRYIESLKALRRMYMMLMMSLINVNSKIQSATSVKTFDHRHAMIASSVTATESSFADKIDCLSAVLCFMGRVLFNFTAHFSFTDK
jgi:hypothetical protein